MDLVDLFYREGKVEEIKYLQKGMKVKLNLPRILSHRLLNNKDIEKLNKNPYKNHDNLVKCLQELYEKVG
jgi:hypothetical protein